MKKTVILAGLISCMSIAFVSCNSGEEEKIKAQKTIDSLQAIVDNKNDEVDALFEVLNEIEDNLASVSSKFGQVEQLQRGQVEGRNDVKLKINDQIQQISQMMTQNKEKLAKLNNQIKTSHQENAKLKEFVEKLETRISEQESQIQDLMAELEQKKIVIENLNKDVVALTETNAEKDKVIEDQVNDMNRVYYIVDTYKNLKEAGIVNKTGGFIGIGKKQQLTNDIDVSLFTSIDKRKVTNIQVNAKGAQVVSKHPEGSYELVLNEDKVCTHIRITNPKEFWKSTSYLVVSTK